MNELKNMQTTYDIKNMKTIYKYNGITVIVINGKIREINGTNWDREDIDWFVNWIKENKLKGENYANK